MAKQQIKTAQDLQQAYPGLCAEIKGQAPIENIDALYEAHPELCKEMTQAVQTKTLHDVDAMSPAQAQASFPKLTAALGTPVPGGLDPNKGFILTADDPFAQGVARHYAGQARCDVPALPCALPYKSEATRSAIENYIVRADGAGNADCVAAAQAALVKCPKKKS